MNELTSTIGPSAKVISALFARMTERIEFLEKKITHLEFVQLDRLNSRIHHVDKELMRLKSGETIEQFNARWNRETKEELAAIHAEAEMSGLLNSIDPEDFKNAN